MPAGTTWSSSPTGCRCTTTPATRRGSPARAAWCGRCSACIRHRHGAWVGWSGLADEDAAPFEHDDIPLVPVTALGRRRRRLLRRLRQRHALAALPRRHPHSDVRAGVVGVLRQRQRALRRGGGRRRGARRRRLGARLPPAARPGDAPRAAARPAHRLLPAHPLPAPGAVHAPAVAGGDPAGDPRRRRGRLPAPGRGREPGAVLTPAARRARRRARPDAGRPRASRSAPSPSRSTWPSSRRCARRPETQALAARLRARLGEPDVVLLGVDRLDYTKGIDVRLEAFRRPAAPTATSTARRCALVQVAVPDPGAASSTTPTSAAGSSSSSARSTASSAGSATRSSTTCTRACRWRSCPRSTRWATSCS